MSNGDLRWWMVHQEGANIRPRSDIDTISDSDREEYWGSIKYEDPDYFRNKAKDKALYDKYKKGGWGYAHDRHYVSRHNKQLATGDFDEDFYNYQKQIYGTGRVFLDGKASADTGYVNIPTTASGGQVHNASVRDEYTGYKAQSQSDKIFQEQINLSKEQLNIQKALADRAITISEAQVARAEQREEQYKRLYQPLEEKEAREAGVGVSPDFVEGRAVADVDVTADPQKRAAIEAYGQAGVDPSSMRAAETASQYDIARAAAEAGARSQAQMGAEDVTRSRRYRAISMGKGLPSEAAVISSAAQSGIMGASQTVAGGYGTALQAMGKFGNIYEQRASSALDRANQLQLAGLQKDETIGAAQAGTAGQLAGSFIGLAGGF